uniref:Uncharacterized protein n=1 Tax=Anguilla anguilla TaxID=7936 RepID=A0A0E9X4P7_ANGAN
MVYVFNIRSYSLISALHFLHIVILSEHIKCQKLGNVIFDLFKDIESNYVIMEISCHIFGTIMSRSNHYTEFHNMEPSMKSCNSKESCPVNILQAYGCTETNTYSDPFT